MHEAEHSFPVVLKSRISGTLPTQSHTLTLSLTGTLLTLIIILDIYGPCSSSIVDVSNAINKYSFHVSMLTCDEYWKLIWLNLNTEQRLSAPHPQLFFRACPFPVTSYMAAQTGDIGATPELSWEEEKSATDFRECIHYHVSFMWPCAVEAKQMYVQRNW